MVEAILNKQFYSNLASYNNKYHLYSKCLKKGKPERYECKNIRQDLNRAYDTVESTVNKLLIKLNNDKPIERKIDREFINAKIASNTKLRLQLQRELDNLYINKGRSGKYDFATESGLLWIVLTTSCIYFIMVKL